jgi:hypothetical protein
VRVHTAANCLWGVASDQPWLVILSGANGTGTDSVRYRVDPNPSSRRRSGVVTAGGRRHVVQQAAGPA